MTPPGASPAGFKAAPLKDRATYLAHHWVGASEPTEFLRASLERHLDAPDPVLIHGECGVGRTFVARLLHAFMDPVKSWRIISPGEDLSRCLNGRDQGVLFREIEAFSLDEQDAIAHWLGNRPQNKVRVFATSGLTSHQVRQHVFIHEKLAAHFLPEMVEVPPLRARLEDIPALCQAWEKTEMLSGRRLSSDAIAWCQARHWPGNIRHLRHVLGRAARVSKERILTREALAESDDACSAAYARPAQTIEDLVKRYVDMLVGDGRDAGDVHTRIIAEVERPMIRRILEVTGKNQLRAAQLLGLNRNTLRKKLKTLDIMLDQL